MISLDEYIEDLPVGDLVALHTWFYDRSKYTAYANQIIDDMLAKEVSTNFADILDMVNQHLVKRLLDKIEGIKSSCDF